MSPKKGQPQQLSDDYYYDFCHSCGDSAVGPAGADTIQGGDQSPYRSRPTPTPPPTSSGVRINGPPPGDRNGNGSGRRGGGNNSVSATTNGARRRRAPPPPHRPKPRQPPAVNAARRPPPPPPARRRINSADGTATMSSSSSNTNGATGIGGEHSISGGGALVVAGGGSGSVRNSASQQRQLVIADSGAVEQRRQRSAKKTSSGSNKNNMLVVAETAAITRFPADIGVAAEIKSSSSPARHSTTKSSPKLSDANHKKKSSSLRRDGRTRRANGADLLHVDRNKSTTSDDYHRSVAGYLMPSSKEPNGRSQQGHQSQSAMVVAGVSRQKIESSPGTNNCDDHHRDSNITNNVDESSKAATKKHSAISSRVNNVCNEIYNYLDELEVKNSQVRESRLSGKKSAHNRPRHLSRSDNSVSSSTPYPGNDEDMSLVATNRVRRRAHHAANSRESSVSPFEGGTFHEDTARGNGRSSSSKSTFEYHSESSCGDQETVKSRSRQNTKDNRRSSSRVSKNKSGGAKLPVLPSPLSNSFDEDIGGSSSDRAGAKGNYGRSLSMPDPPQAYPSIGSKNKQEQLNWLAGKSSLNSSFRTHLTDEDNDLPQVPSSTNRNKQERLNWLAGKSSLNSSTRTHLTDEENDLSQVPSSANSLSCDISAAVTSQPRGRSRGRYITRSSNKRNSSMTRLHCKVRNIASSTRRHCQSVDRMDSLSLGFKRLSFKGEKGFGTGSTRSTASLSTDMSDCDSSIMSAIRSFQHHPSSKKGGKARRRGSSLSRHAQNALDTLSTTYSAIDTPKDGANNANKTSRPSSADKVQSSNYHLIDQDDSKASMVYDVPFDPLTGRCNYHPSVCMAIKMEEEMAGTSSEGGVDSDANAEIVGGWKIVRTTCPKCMYHY